MPQVLARAFSFAKSVLYLSHGSTKVGGNTAATTSSGAPATPSYLGREPRHSKPHKKNSVEGRGWFFIQPSAAAHLFAVKDVALADAEAVCESIHHGVRSYERRVPAHRVAGARPSLHLLLFLVASARGRGTAVIHSARNEARRRKKTESQDIF